MPGQEKIRVLIVDDIAETRENIRRMLQFDTNLDVVGTARTGAEAIEQTIQLKPDVLIMDINMPDMDGITATDSIKRKLPYAQVVILSVQSDPSYMRRAMLAGARDFLTKPPNIDELTAAVRRAGAMAHDERKKLALDMEPGQPVKPKASARGKVIAIYSPKGGTGRTTIATNLAVALHSDDSKVALIDANLHFGELTVFFNEQSKNSILDLTLRAEDLDPDIVNEVMINHRTTGIHILPSPSKPELAEKVNGEQFSKLLEYLRHLYSYIIVDTIAQLDDITLMTLEVTDVIVLITTQDIPSIRNSSQFLSIIDSAGLRNRIIFVMNRFDKRIGLTSEKVGDSLKQPIAAVIPDDRLIAMAANRGIPFILENKTNPLSKSFTQIADLVKEKLAKLENPEAEAVPKK